MSLAPSMCPHYYLFTAPLTIRHCFKGRKQQPTPAPTTSRGRTSRWRARAQARGCATTPSARRGLRLRVQLRQRARVVEHALRRRALFHRPDEFPGGQAGERGQHIVPGGSDHNYRVYAVRRRARVHGAPDGGVEPPPRLSPRVGDAVSDAPEPRADGGGHGAHPAAERPSVHGACSEATCAGAKS